MIKMVEYRRIVVCVFMVKNGWVAKYITDYMGEAAAYSNGKILPGKLAREMFPDISGRYNPRNG